MFAGHDPQLGAEAPELWACSCVLVASLEQFVQRRKVECASDEEGDDVARLDFARGQKMTLEALKSAAPDPNESAEK